MSEGERERRGRLDAEAEAELGEDEGGGRLLRVAGCGEAGGDGEVGDADGDDTCTPVVPSVSLPSSSSTLPLLACSAMASRSFFPSSWSYIAATMSESICILVLILISRSLLFLASRNAARRARFALNSRAINTVEAKEREEEEEEEEEEGEGDGEEEGESDMMNNGNENKVG